MTAQVLPGEHGQGMPMSIYQPEATRGSETILLVEDEPVVRLFVRYVLQDAGYTVLEAGNGLQAIQVVENFAGRIHLLLSDVIMPEMGGRLLAERMTAIRPGVKVLFMSAYTGDTIVHQGVEEGVRAFLQKPFTAVALIQKVRVVLHQTA